MDDYNVSSLNNSQHEWAIKLLNILVPHIVEGIDSIFNEALKICKENKESTKYLMTFQNLLSRIPKWNNSIIDTETKRIVERSKCLYLEDLISCVHISHLKILTSVRVGKTQKKLKIDIPNLKDFIHKVYINCGRQLYTVIYLFENDVQPIMKQKNKKDVEEHVKTCILNSIRESIPVEEILRAYMDESTDLLANVNKEIIKEEVVQEENVDNMSEAKNTTDENKDDVNKETSLIKLDSVATSVEKVEDVKPIVENLVVAEPVNNDDIKENIKENIKLSFSEMDKTIDVNKKEEIVPAPKDVETLEKISNDNHIKRKEEEEEDYNSDDEKISISNEKISLDVLDINDVGQTLNNDNLLSEVEVLS